MTAPPLFWLAWYGPFGISTIGTPPPPDALMSENEMPKTVLLEGKQFSSFGGLIGDKFSSIILSGNCEYEN